MEYISYMRDDTGKMFGVMVAIGPHTFGWAICSSKDQFCRKTGKAIARNRANADITYWPAPYNGPGGSSQEVLAGIAMIEVFNVNLPILWADMQTRINNPIQLS